MFICDECLKRYENEQSLIRSLGPCELCKKTRPCNDIPSRWLVSKKAPSGRKGILCKKGGEA